MGLNCKIYFTAFEENKEIKSDSFSATPQKGKERLLAI
jgi:hypothetical protein